MDADPDIDEYDLEKLRAEIAQEKQMNFGAPYSLNESRNQREMLDQSASELRNTVDELEKRYEAIENEGNEWKTRFETQEEINQQLEKQVILLQDKVEEAKRNLKDAINQQRGLSQGSNDNTRAYVEGRLSSTPAGGSETPKSKSTGITINISVSPQAGKSPRDMKGFDDLSDYSQDLKRFMERENQANPGMVKGMEKEKHMLYNQLRDLEWRLDQESKAYHKANDERKQYVLEINSTKGNIDGNKARQRAAVNVQQREVDDLSRSPRLLGNIPEDQRIIDPKHGPIKRTAAVKTLPSLET